MPETTPCYVIARRITGESWELSNLEYATEEDWSVYPENAKCWHALAAVARFHSEVNCRVVLCDRVEVPGAETIEVVEGPMLDTSKECVIRYHSGAHAGRYVRVLNSPVDIIWMATVFASARDAYINATRMRDILNIRRATTAPRVEIRPVRVLP